MTERKEIIIEKGLIRLYIEKSDGTWFQIDCMTKYLVDLIDQDIAKMIEVGNCSVAYPPDGYQVRPPQPAV